MDYNTIREEKQGERLGLHACLEAGEIPSS